MPKNLLVVNCDLRETRVALIEDGVIAELVIERAGHVGTVGNIVLGKVTRVLPGMQAAFIDVGQDRAAFLHVEDLIRPDDFEAYLSGGAREDADGAARGEGGRRSHGQPGAAAAGEGDDDETEDDEAEEPAAAGSARNLPRPGDEGDGGPESDGGSEATEAPPARRRVVAPRGPSSASAASEETAPDSGDDAQLVAGTDEDATDDDPPDSDVGGAEPGEGTLAEAAEPKSGEHAPSEAQVAEAPGRRRRRRRGKKVAAAPVPARPSREVRKAGTLRVAKNVPITEVVREGDEVIVQISKEPIGTKGARVTSHVSLAGRYVVYLPTVEHVGISKRIGSQQERLRLRKVIEAMKPPKGGLVVRTVAEGLTKKSLKADIGYLVKLWDDVVKKREGARAPSLLHSELDLVLRVARDFFTEEIDHIVIDDRDQHRRLVRFLEMFLPERVKDVELYAGEEPIFDAYGIEDEIGRALSRKVPLKSGGHLVIDQAEALTAIDVNTGRFVGKGSRDLEETALKTNLEAVEEIAYQLRFRNIGGLVILDLIDMDHSGNREKVYRRLEQLLARDKAKTTINRISELGLIEMTRKRTRESLMRTMHEPCFYCDGTGQIQSKTTIAYEILRQIRRERAHLPGYVVVVAAHPAVVDLLQGEERAAVQEAEKRYMRRIELSPRREYHIEQFDLSGR